MACLGLVFFLSTKRLEVDGVLDLVKNSIFKRKFYRESVLVIFPNA